MDNLGLETQESETDIVLDENEFPRNGNGFGVKKRSFTLDVKTTLLEEVDAAKLVDPKVSN